MAFCRYSQPMHPHPAFSGFLLQTKLLHQSTLASPLGGPGVPLAWPKGDPWVTQTQAQSQTQSAEGRGSGFQLPNYQITQLPNFQRPCASRRCQNIAQLLERINSEYYDFIMPGSSKLRNPERARPLSIPVYGGLDTSHTPQHCFRGNPASDDACNRAQSARWSPQRGRSWKCRYPEGVRRSSYSTESA